MAGSVVIIWKNHAIASSRISTAEGGASETRPYKSGHASDTANIIGSSGQFAPQRFMLPVGFHKPRHQSR